MRNQHPTPLKNSIGIDIFVPDPKIKPAYAHEGDGAFDLQARITGTLTVYPGERVTIPTGVFIAIPQGYGGLVTPKSGPAHKKGITVTNSPGLIDHQYRGEVGVILQNDGGDQYVIDPYDRIAQFMIVPVYTAIFNFRGSVEELGATTRGAGGFGSTGVKG